MVILRGFKVFGQIFYEIVLNDISHLITIFQRTLPIGNGSYFHPTGPIDIISLI